MILQKLSECYDLLKTENKVPDIEYSTANVGQVVELNEDGTINNIIQIKKKLEVPLQQRRSNKITPYFLCDLPKYFFGKESKKGVVKDTLNYWKASQLLHEEILKNINSPRAKAILNFFEKVKKHESLDFEIELDNYEPKQTAFKLTNEENYIHEDNEIKEAWSNYLLETLKKESIGQCLVSGKEDQPISRIHNPILISGGASTGSSLVNFNKESYCSYGKEQGENSPTSFTEMSKYVAALKALLASENNCCHLSDMDVVFWASTGSYTLETCFVKEFLGYFKEKKEEEVSNIESEPNIEEVAETALLTLCNCKEDKKINSILAECKNTKIYLMGFSPNKSRIMSKLYYEIDFETLVDRVKAHYKRLYLGRDMKIPITIVSIIRSSTREGKLKDAYDEVKSALISSILDNTDYPSYLVQMCYKFYCMAKVNSQSKDTILNYIRLAVIKGHLIQKGECTTMKLDKENLDIGYNLGRLFAVFEAVQMNVGNKIFKELYYFKACDTTYSTMNTLFQMNGIALGKIQREKKDLGVYYNGMIDEIIENIDFTKIPRVMSIKEAMHYHFGYEHQMEYIYTKKENKIEGEEDNE